MKKSMMKRIVSVTMALFMMPWSSFIYGSDVYALSIDDKRTVISEDITATQGDAADIPVSNTRKGLSKSGAEEGPQEEENTYEDYIVTGDLTLNEDMEVASLLMSPSSSLNLNGHTLIVHDDYKMGSGSGLYFNNGAILCYGSFNNNQSSGHIVMQGVNDYLLVEGLLDLTNGSYDIQNGTIEAKGDIVLSKKFIAAENSSLILSGNTAQYINQSNGSMLGNVILRNYSDEGIILYNIFDYTSIENNGCKVSIADQEGISGYVLTEDEEKDGLFILGAGTLDLNGHTLTINGDFYHTGGKLKINNGSLIISGSYKMQKRIVSGEDVTYTNASSQLEMTQEDDYIQVGGDFVVENSAKTNGKITNGTIEILGDIHIDNTKGSNGFVPSGDSTMLLSSDNPQCIELTGNTGLIYGHLHNLTLRNTSEEGVTFVNPICISGSFDQGETLITGDVKLAGEVDFVNESYTGDIVIQDSTTLKGKLNINGNLVIDNALTVEGSVSASGDIINNTSLNVTGLLSSGGNYNSSGYASVSGELDIAGDAVSQSSLRTIALSNGSVNISGSVGNIVFDMTHEDDYVLIAGDYNTDFVDSTTHLKNGITEIKGDIDAASFIASGNHKLLLSGDGLQTVSNSDAMSLGVLELNNNSEEGVFFDKVVQKNELIRNGCRLRYGNLAGEFGWTLTDDQEIDGDLIIIDDELDLNGHTLHVGGDLIQMSGNININGGELIIDGDYRMQTIEDGEYAISASSLTMTNEDDKVTVNGDYYVSSSVDNKGRLTNGALTLNGNFYITKESNDNAFYGTDSFKVVLGGEFDKTIDTNRIIYIPVLENSCEGKVTAKKTIKVDKNLICDYEDDYKGTVYIGYSTELTGDGFSGSIISDSYDKTINQDYHIGGNLTGKGSLFIKGKLTIDGNYYHGCILHVYDDVTIGENITTPFNNSYSIKLYDSSTFSVNGDVTITNKGDFSFESDDSVLIIKGDYNCNNKGGFNKGTVYIGGDFTSTGFYANDSNRVIFNGDTLQTINVAESCHFATIELNNSSEEGVVSKTVFNKDTFIRNNTNFRYEGLDGIFGYKLTKDETIEGDLVLIDDSLDLNGYTLTVNGDFIQMSGNVLINGGSLIVFGDYRQQKRELNDGSDTLTGNQVYKYSAGSAKLTMTNENDYVEIGGNFIINTTADNRYNQTNGIICLAGNINYNIKNGSYGFYPSNSLCLKLVGDSNQSIKHYYGDKEYETSITIPSLIIETDYEDYELSGSDIIISKIFRPGTAVVNQKIQLLSRSKLIGDVFNGYLNVNTSLTDDLVINGELHGTADISGNVTVNGKTYLDKLTLNKGSLTVNNDFAVQTVNMTHSEDSLNVTGDFMYQGGGTNATDGVITIGGNFKDYYYNFFNTTKNNRIIFNGTARQVIYMPSGHFATVELQNYSSEGVYSDSLFDYDTIIKNGCKLTYGFGSTTEGFVLEGDYTYSGDMIFADGEIDLNGHTLTIDGDLIHAGGTIKINNGKLIVKNDLREQSPYGSSYIGGKGSLVLENKMDSITVGGDLYLDSDNTSKMKTGYIYVEGNLKRTTNSKKFDFDSRIVLCGSDTQTVDSNITGLTSLDINTKNKLIINGTSFEVSKYLSSSCRNITKYIDVPSLNVITSPYHGNINLGSRCVLVQDVEIIGNLTVYNKLDINGKNLYVNNLVLSSYGSLTMDDADGYISVANDMTVNSLYRYNSSYNSILTDGCIEINGNFDCQRYSYFTASDNHIVIFTPKKRTAGTAYRQSVSFGDDNNRTSRFNTLILRGREESFIFDNEPDTIANEVIYEYEYADDLKPVSNLAVVNATEDTITISFADENENPKATGYEIYRNGTKIGTTDRTEYTDRNLKPNTIYKYTVFAMDSYWNLSLESEELSAQTLRDTDAPSVPTGLHVSSRTGNTIGLSWTGARDNVGVAGYVLYKNGELLKKLSALEYIDTDVAKDEINIYKLSAIDAAGNESEKSEEVVAMVATPKINRIYPTDYSRIGGNSVELKAYYKNYGEGSRNSVNIEYQDSEGEWVKINDAPLGQTLYNSSEYVSSYTWNIASLDSDNIKVRYILTDNTGAQDIYEAEYDIDHTYPENPVNLATVDNNGVIELTWKVSASSDFSKYNIYRYIVDGSDQTEVYSKVSEITDKYSARYEDNDLSEGTEARYIITSVDDMGNESPCINPVTVTVGADSEAPEVTELEPSSERITGNAKLTAYAKDNKNISDIKFYMISESEMESMNSSDIDYNEWTLLGKGSTPVISDNIYSSSINIDTTSYTDGIYFIAAVAEDSSGNKNIDDFYTRYEIDNTGIQKITINKTNPGSTYVQLMWDDVTDDDFDYFLIERLEGDSFKEVNREYGVTGSTINGLTPETEYSFRVCGVDKLGNKGEYSDVVNVSTLDDTSSPSITAVYPVQGRLKDSIPLSMTVSDNYKVAGGTWSLSFDGENYTEIASVSGSSTNEVFKYMLDISDIEKYPEGSIFIKSEAVDEAGNKNLLTADGSEIIMQYIIDRTAPVSVKNASARANDGYISIIWDEAEEEDIASYKVYRADMEKGIYRCVMNSASIDYYDIDIEDGKSYAYYVTAVDEAGNESERSNISFATAIPDETIPKVAGVSPSDNSKIGANAKFSIIVTDNSALSRVKTYYRANESDSWVLLNESNVSGRSAWPTFTTDLSNETEGNIFFKTVCEDRNGNISEDFLYSCRLDTTPPVAEISAVGGNLETVIDLKRDILESDVSYYEIYRCELSQSGKNKAFFDNAQNIEKVSVSAEETIEGQVDKRRIRYRDTDIIPHTAYRYAAKVYDSVGNYSWTEIANAIATDTDNITPTIVMPDKITTIVGMEVGLDAGDCSDNVRIKSFTWDMGNGDTCSGARPKYTYRNSGKYTVKLTVTDTSGNKSEKEIEVHVKEASNNGICNLTVVDYSGNPIPYAYVYINTGSDSDTAFMTDAYGKVSLCYKAGTYRVAAFKDGYLPEEQDYIITNMKTTEEVLRLSSGEVVVGNFEVHRMSIQEIVDAGVDLSSPANINTFTFKTTLTFQKSPIPVVVDTLSGDERISGGGDLDGGGFGFPNFPIDWGGFNSTSPPSSQATYMTVNTPAEEPVPVMAVMSVTQSVSWLKNMYSAGLTIMNMADSKYVLEDSKGSIELPDGVSLAVLDESKRLETGTNSGQLLTIDMGDISGQNSKTVSWTLKGDRSGKYDLNAVYSGILTPFNIPITKSFKAETEIELDSADIVITVKPESAYYLGEDYYIHYSIKNNGTEDLYNFTTSIGDYRVPNEKEVVYIMDPDTEEITDTQSTGVGLKYTLTTSEQLYQMPVLSGNDSITIPVLKSGESIYGTWKYGEGDYHSSGFAGDSQREYFALVSSIVDVLEGENLGVTVKVEPIKSHISKMIKTYYQDEDIVIKTGDPVDMTSGAFTDSYTAVSLSGKDNLDYILSYDSVTASECGKNSDYNEQTNNLGTGWTGSFSSYVKEENGFVKYYSNPYAYTVFISENSFNGKLYGEAAEDGALKLGNENSDDDIVFVSATHGMEGYTLTRHSDGTYELRSPIGEILSYDVEGRLSHVQMEDGSVTNVSYTEHQQIITEEISGNRLIITKNDKGQIISISDGGDKVTNITYSGDDITAITDAIGRETSFKYDDNHRIVSETNNSGTEFIQNEYDDEGRIVKQTDALGKEISFEYSETEDGGIICDAITKAEGKTSVSKEVVTDIKGRVVSVVNESGSTESYTYDAEGNVNSKTDGYGNTVSYSYDEDGRLIQSGGIVGQNYSVTYDDKGNVSAISSDGDTSDYQYDSNNNLIYSNVFGAETVFAYDENNLLIKEERQGKGEKTYSYTGGVLTSSTDELGRTTGYKFDNSGNLIEMISPDGSKVSYNYNAVNQKISETDANGNTSYYTYNDLNLVSSVTDALGNKTSYEYDPLGNLTREIRPDGSEIKYINDALGNMVETIYPNGVTYKYEYDSCGNNTKILYPDGTTEEFTYDSNGNITSAKDKKGNITTYTQNNTVEKLDSVTDCYGNNISYTYDDQGRNNVISMTQGILDTYTYDIQGNISSYTDTLGNTTRYNYNEWGELLDVKDSNGNITELKYDATGNCIEKKTPEGLDIFYTYDVNNNIISVKTNVQGKEIEEKYTYDSMGNVLTYTDTMGRVTSYTYDKLNRPVTEKTPDGITTTLEYDCLGNLIRESESDGSSIEAEYDEVGRVVSLTSIGTISKESSRIYEYTYDSMDRLTSSVDPMNGETGQTYDELGNVTSMTDAMGGTTTYTYDKTSRILSETNAIGATKKYTYDERGRLATEENARGQKTVYEYDDYNRLISFTDEEGTVNYTYDNNSNIISISDESGTITREYDNLNRVTSVTDSNGRTVKYSYDELGNILTLTYPGGEIVRYEYYPDGLLKTVTDNSNNKTTYEYDSAGRLIKTINPDNSTVEETYDKSGNLKTKIDKSSSGDVILSYEYGYDGFGNITSIKDNISSNIDNLSYTASDSAESSTSVDKMEYDSANRLISFNGEEVKYDADGNMIYGPLNDEMVSFEYDCRNRLIRAGDITYTYDAENLRTATNYGNYTEEYVLDRVTSPNRTLQIVRKDNSGDSLTAINDKTTNYYHGQGLIYEKSDEKLLIYHYDHLGSTRKITDKTGKLLYSFKYDTYGELLSIWDGQLSTDISSKLEQINIDRPVRFLYNGAVGVITDNNNLYYMRQRYYNSTIKRFINQDVLIGEIHNSQSLNRYAYVQGNPVNYTDPFGLNPVHILKAYSGVVHDILNVASVIPGPVGAVSGLINAGIYALEGDYSTAGKCLIVAGLTAFVGPLAGAAIGGLCKLSTSARVITSIAAIGAGMYAVGTSAYDLSENAIDFVDALTREGGSDPAELFHYFSNMLVDSAGVIFGVTGIAGGIGGLKDQCFVEGTQIKTEDGNKNIEDIEKGDKVYSSDPETGETDLKEVKQVFVNEADTIVHIKICDEDTSTIESIDTTEKHPFYVVDYGFKYASELKIGDEVKSLSGDIYSICEVSIDRLKVPIHVYNFEVEDWHTYYVSEAGLLVHNLCKTTPNTTTEASTQGSAAVGEGGSKSIKPYEVTTYDDFRTRSVVGDGLEGHEMWQHSNMKNKGYATTRLSTEASKNNPVIALPHEVHVDVNRQQYLFDGKNQTPFENIINNANIMYNNNDIPNEQVTKQLIDALKHLDGIGGD